MTDIKVSFVIITWNGLHYIRTLLNSMKELMEDPAVEVVLVDNGSSDGTATYIREIYKKVVLLELPYNRGVSFARNRGIEVSNGKYIFIIDNDIVMKTDVAKAMIDYMDTHPDVGICGCKLHYENGDVQESCKCFPKIDRKVRSVLNIGHLGCYYEKQMNCAEPFEPEYVIGACQLIRREASQVVGEIDENIFYGPEDCDYCLRIKKAGWKVIYLPQYDLLHYCQRKTHTHPFSILGFHHLGGLLYLYWKYKRIK